MTETVRQSICRTVLIVVDILFINLSIGRNILDKYKFIGQNKITFYNRRTRRERRRKCITSITVRFILGWHLRSKLYEDKFFGRQYNRRGKIKLVRRIVHPYSV